MNRAAAGLFGGALFAAGIARAQEFHFELNDGGNSPVSYGYCYGTDLPGIGSFDRDLDVNYNPSSPFFTVSAHYSGFGGTARLNATTMEADAFASSFGGVGFGQATAYAYFSVTAPADLLFEWDFSDEQPPFPFENSELRFVDWTAGGTTVFLIEQGGPASGSTTFPVSPGTFYAVRILTLAYESFGGSSGSIEILPAACFCDLDGSGALNLDDVVVFADAFVLGDLLVDFDANGVLNLDDVVAFADCFTAGCP